MDFIYFIFRPGAQSLRNGLARRWYELLGQCRIPADEDHCGMLVGAHCILFEVSGFCFLFTVVYPKYLQ